MAYTNLVKIKIFILKKKHGKQRELKTFLNFQITKQYDTRKHVETITEGQIMHFSWL